MRKAKEGTCEASSGRREGTANGMHAYENRIPLESELLRVCCARRVWARDTDWVCDLATDAAPTHPCWLLHVSCMCTLMTLGLAARWTLAHSALGPPPRNGPTKRSRSRLVDDTSRRRVRGELQ
eukprot:2832702-Prymnesium_polylepis.1